MADDSEAEGELVRRYSQSMFYVINNIVRNDADAEDLLQDMFIIALKKIRHGDLNDPRTLSGYVRGIAKRVAWRHAGTAKNRSFTSVDGVPPPADPRRSPLEQLMMKEEVEFVRQVLGELTQERDRQIIIRYYDMEEDKETICAELGLTGEHFNRVRSRAIKRFKELYAEKRGSTKTRDETPDSR